MRFFKKIEFYLITLSVFCFSITFFFKEKTVSRFYEFDSMLNKFLIESKNGNNGKFFYDFEKEFDALIFLDRSLKVQTGKLKDSNINDENYKNDLMIFQSQIQELKRKMNFSYDSILYTSIFLLAVAFFMIFKKNSEKIKQLSDIKLINETQNTISRDLHDTVIQDLKTLKLYLDKNDSESNKLKNYYLNQAYNEARYLMSSINDIDFNKDFTEILRETLITFENNHKIKANFFEATNLLQSFNLKKKIEIYRIFQEALNNIARHSKATLITVKIVDLIFENMQTVRITINDNGIGIKDEDFQKENHYGLKNIQERVELSGGRIKIERGEKNGTTITIEY